MDHLDAMYVGDGPAPNELTFRINLHTPGAIEQVGFVHYVHEKFEGVRTGIERLRIAPHYAFGSIALRFPDEQAAAEAKAFCSRNMTKSGMPGHEVRRDVKHSDLRDRKAGSWMRELHDAPIKEAAAPTDELKQAEP